MLETITNKSLAKNFTLNGLLRVNKMFTWEAVAMEMAKVYSLVSGLPRLSEHHANWMELFNYYKNKLFVPLKTGQQI
ncbi:MAG: hypothetical protein ACK40G_03170 [Cytophagaceae bacterium]